MSCVGTLILGGGTGTRMLPLTLTRCKPAISFGGRYRLIDIPLSNALNSGCEKIYILTQFLSASLHQHILKSYRMEQHSNGFVEILSAEQKPTKKVWYQGTADAIRQNIEYLAEADVDYFLILSGDQLYQMDYTDLIAFAEETQVDLVVATTPVDEATAKRMGILKIDDNNLIVDFAEKPQSKASLEPFRVNPAVISRLLGKKQSAPAYLGSMGIYLFKRDALIDLLEKDPREDFGKHLIPTQVKKGTAGAYIFPGYWEDIGTIESFHRANIALTESSPPFDLFNEKLPIHSAFQSLPPPKINQTRIESSLICEGSIIDAESISKSIIGPRSKIGKGTVISESYLFGNDHYAQPNKKMDQTAAYSIGERCHIHKAIIDKQVQIGNDVKLINQAQHDSYESDLVYIRDGILIVSRGARIPDGFVL